MGRSHAFKNALAVTSLAVLSVGGVLVILELVVRYLDVRPRPMEPLAIPTYRLSDNPVLLYEYQPNYRRDAAAYDSSHRGFATNSDGFRDYEYQRKKPKDTFRIVILGDSTTARNGVRNLDRIYAKVLERKLNESNAGGLKFEVLNLGVGGYHTLQEAELLRTKGLQYEPDLVLLTFCINDFEIEADGYVYRNLLNAKNRAEKDGFISEWLKYIYNKSRLVFVTVNRTRQLLRHHSVEEQGDVAVRSGLRLISALQRDHDFKLRIFILPAFKTPFSRYQYDSIHARFLKAAGPFDNLDVTDLKPHFAAYGDDGTGQSYDGLHLNKKVTRGWRRSYFQWCKRLPKPSEALRRANRPVPAMTIHDLNVHRAARLAPPRVIRRLSCFKAKSS